MDLEPWWSIIEVKKGEKRKGKPTTGLKMTIILWARRTQKLFAEGEAKIGPKLSFLLVSFWFLLGARVEGANARIVRIYSLPYRIFDDKENQSGNAELILGLIRREEQPRQNIFLHHNKASETTKQHEDFYTEWTSQRRLRCTDSRSAGRQSWKPSIAPCRWLSTTTRHSPHQHSRLGTPDRWWSTWTSHFRRHVAHRQT